MSEITHPHSGKSKNLLLGVTGSVAAYRAADLARDAMREGFNVRVCLTRSAAKFVTPALFEALTGEHCLIDTFEEPSTGRMAHIDWARWADLICIAPASATTLNKLAHGIGDNMLTTIALATKAPIMVAPAMNPAMWSNDATQSSISTLSSRGYTVIQPGEGEVACGEEGQGKLASNSEILDQIRAEFEIKSRLRGKRVLITSGPSVEPIDSVRFLSNHSSGKMGASLAKSALRMGAEVTLISGPTAVPLPEDAKVIHVRTASEFLNQGLDWACDQDLIIGVAAIADYRVEAPFEGKIRKSDEILNLKLVPNPDVISALAKANPKARTIGFAAEPSDDPDYVLEKLRRKGLYAIASNDVSRSDIGFGSDFNDLILYFPDGRVESSGRLSKIACAFWLFEQISV